MSVPMPLPTRLRRETFCWRQIEKMRREPCTSVLWHSRVPVAPVPAHGKRLLRAPILPHNMGSGGHLDHASLLEFSHDAHVLRLGGREARPNCCKQVGQRLLCLLQESQPLRAELPFVTSVSETWKWF